ncbi:hypothetical protein LSH36_13g19054 [Paralvinella palmiformis]|uniref:Cytochrome c oxidase subunit 7C, mitochondrial n=1 Tax=Paralvinella palmiformis TaxID=53620 RepID=A0AAD9KC58_9ANNE|nr:hypothetical protein LSH36_13g19054 [Paralvinella palmiformis]
MLSKVGRLTHLTRQFSTSVVRRSEEWQQRGLPGSNMPFNIGNRYKLMAAFIAFFGSGLGVPYLLVRHQLLKE